MKKDFWPAGTTPTWLVTQGTWPRREELHCAATRRLAETWILNQHSGKTPKGIHVEKAHIIYLDKFWHRVYVNPLTCRVPEHLKPNPELLRERLGLPPEPPRVYTITHVPAPKPFTWRERIRILFTGFPNEYPS